MKSRTKSGPRSLVLMRSDGSRTGDATETAGEMCNFFRSVFVQEAVGGTEGENPGIGTPHVPLGDLIFHELEIL